MTTLRNSFRDTTQRLAFALLAGAFLLFALDTAGAHGFKIGDLEIGHPWARMTPAGAKVGGGYLSIENEGSIPDRLVSVSVPADITDHTEIHEMSVVDGVMKMNMLPNGLEVPAKGEVKLAPGGYHLMFIGLKQPLKEGDSFKGTLTFEKAGKVDVVFKVEGMGGPKGMEAGGAMPAGHDHSAPAN